MALDEASLRRYLDEAATRHMLTLLKWVIRWWHAADRMRLSILLWKSWIDGWVFSLRQYFTIYGWLWWDQMRLDLCAEICTLIPVAGSHGRASSWTFFLFPPHPDWYKPVGKKLGLMLVGKLLATRIIVSNAKNICKLTKRLGSRQPFVGFFKSWNGTSPTTSPIMSLGGQSGLPWSKVNAAQQAGNLMLECFGRNDAHAFVEDECFLFHPLKIKCLHHIDGSSRMRKNDDMVERPQFFFHFTVFVILNFCGCDAKGIYATPTMLWWTQCLFGKEKTSAADLVTKYDRQVEDLVLARLRPGKRREVKRNFASKRGDSKWPFDPRVGGHPWKANFPK